MPLPYSDEALMIVALERLRVEVANMPLAFAANANRTPPSLKPTAFDRPQAVVVMGPNPLPVVDVGGKGGKSSGPTAGKTDEGLLSKAIKQFIGTFTAMLGPIAIFASIIGSELSGVRVLTSALNVFASAVAPILLPAVYMLSVALVAASDVIWNKLAPKLEGFYRVIIEDLIPTVEHFADVAGKAAEALLFLAKAAGMAGPGSSGGLYGGLNRLTSGTSAGIEGALDDLVRVMTIGTAEPALRGKNWLKEQLGIGGGGAPGASEEARRATAQAQLDVKRELLMSMGSQGGVGGLQTWAAAQQAAVSMTPFQVKVLERLNQAVAALERAGTGPATAAYGGGSGIFGAAIDDVVAAAVRVARGGA